MYALQDSRRFRLAQMSHPPLKTLAFVLVVLSASPSLGLAQTTRKPLSKTAPAAGTVESNHYKNDSLGLELSAAPGLRFGAPELKGIPGNVPVLVTVAASNGHDVPTSTETTVFYADDLGYYREDRRSTQAYVNRLVQAQTSQGLELVTDSNVAQLSGMRFARADFRRTGLYEIVFMKACNAYAFVFIFAAPDSDGAIKLFKETDITLDTAKSGCSDDQ